MNAHRFFVTTILAAAIHAVPAVAQNTNDDAPQVSHSIEFEGGAKIEVSYRQLRLAGGRNLRTLLAADDSGTNARTFYNDTYLPRYLNGSITTSVALNIGGQKVAQGRYSFTLRIEEDLSWRLVLRQSGKDTANLAIQSSRRDTGMVKRLVFEPVAKSNDAPEGHFSIRYGPLTGKIAFAPAESD